MMINGASQATLAQAQGDTARKQATFRKHAAFGGGSGISFENVQFAGYYLKHNTVASGTNKYAVAGAN